MYNYSVAVIILMHDYMYYRIQPDLVFRRDDLDKNMDTHACNTAVRNTFGRYQV